MSKWQGFLDYLRDHQMPEIKVGDPFVWCESPDFAWVGVVVEVDGDLVHVAKNPQGPRLTVRRDLPKPVWAYMSD